MKSKIALLLAAGLILSSGFALAADDKEAAQKLFESKCSVCHPTQKPLSFTKDLEGWTVTVKRMQSKKPDNLADAEAEAIIKYLSQVRGVGK